MVKNLLTGLWLVNPRLRPGVDSENSPGVDRAQETRTDLLESPLIDILSVLPSSNTFKPRVSLWVYPQALNPQG